jgi:hypothetical protein
MLPKERIGKQKDWRLGYEEQTSRSGVQPAPGAMPMLRIPFSAYEPYELEGNWRCCQFVRVFTS